MPAFRRDPDPEDLLRVATAGSVDDGKSTLIGRMLYDTQNVYEDQLQVIAEKGRTGPGMLDLSLLTDGLNAEVEQGITIDVAYRHLVTARRRFLLADTPGHLEYTRNMITGASTADAAIVLLDVRRGVMPQSVRHACLAALLGVRDVIVAVNKMDLAGFQEGPFRSVELAFIAAYDRLRLPHPAEARLHFIPVSALHGDNVAFASKRMPWYGGVSVLGRLESLPANALARHAPFRMAVQRVVRAREAFCGFAGQISSGAVRVGDCVLLLPSRSTSRVRRIVTFDGDLEEACAPRSVTLTLDEEVDLNRGDLLADPDRPPTTTQSFTATLVWMDETPLNSAQRYLLKHTTRTVFAVVHLLPGSFDLAGYGAPDGAALGLNGIRQVSVETSGPLFLDPYAADRATGSFILIDPETHATIAAGMVGSRLQPHS